MKICFLRFPTSQNLFYAQLLESSVTNLVFLHKCFWCEVGSSYYQNEPVGAI